MMQSYLVTGASRGIGLGMIEELLRDPLAFVIAAARNPSVSSGLQNLTTKYTSDRLALITLDYASEESINKGAQEASVLLPNGLDYLVCNAGVSLQGTATFDEIDLKVFEEELRINTVAPLQVVRSFLPLVRKGNGKKIVLLTSNLGSLEVAPHLSALSITYSMTKAALNMLARKWAAALNTEGIAVVLIHPGWVDTEMGNLITDWIKAHSPEYKMISVEESVKGCIKVFKEAKPETLIKFYNYDGSLSPW